MECGRLGSTGLHWLLIPLLIFFCDGCILVFLDPVECRSLQSGILRSRRVVFLGVGESSFNLHVLRSCASSILICFSFMHFLITSLHLSFGLPIFLGTSTSMFSVLIKLHWLPVRRRIEYKILSHTYRAIHRQAPHYTFVKLYRCMNQHV